MGNRLGFAPRIAMVNHPDARRGENDAPSPCQPAVLRALGWGRDKGYPGSQEWLTVFDSRSASRRLTCEMRCEMKITSQTPSSAVGRKAMRSDANALETLRACPLKENQP